MKKIASILVCCCMLMSLGACGGASGGWKPDDNAIPMNDTFFNPIRIESQMGDPWMYKRDGYYYYMHSEGARITLTKSKWMTQNTLNGEDESVTKVVTTEKLCGLDEFWAPEIFWFAGSWYIYVTATQDNLGDFGRKTHIFKSKTADAMGEWDYVGRIALPYDTYAIDATFMDCNGKQYIVWSGRSLKEGSSITLDFKQELYITELVTGDPTKAKSTADEAGVKISTPTEEWEIQDGPINEGAVFIHTPDGTPMLLYSASHSMGNQYCIAYLTLTGSDPMNAAHWTKCDAPLMQADFDRGIYGPGHNSVVLSPDDSEYWIVYHTAKRMNSAWDRMARLQKLEWKDGKTPYVEKIARFSDAVKMPSGEKTNRYRYEAESAELTEGCTIIDSTDTDEDGTPFDYASGGKAVQPGGDTDKITFHVTVPENGKYIIGVRYSNDSATASTISVSVNGSAVRLYTPRTQDKEMFSQNKFYAGLYVKPDKPNVIEITCDKNILIDCIVVDYLDRK